eukprot:3035904-Pyramimonas_sp.AAC.1
MQWCNLQQLNAAKLDREQLRIRLEAQVGGGDLDGGGVSASRIRRRLLALERRARIWVPFARRLVLRDVLVDGVP